MLELIEKMEKLWLSISRRLTNQQWHFQLVNKTNQSAEATLHLNEVLCQPWSLADWESQWYVKVMVINWIIQGAASLCYSDNVSFSYHYLVFANEKIVTLLNGRILSAIVELHGFDVTLQCDYCLPNYTCDF